ncbi:hypothetical protein [Antarcticimicrobium luteum]|uniref:Uncharacterized protein n=1 Tax=Antarcticimicrobium luteum TaxID=2547397 RepID=A0A4R5UV03_9RHOB|nr:hypothetical protein [Antarcticimicrobium luteum]TDK43029.1 hypothetical protein E1832_17340 [Antarcticimicrobium luteum]
MSTRTSPWFRPPVRSTFRAIRRRLRFGKVCGYSGPETIIPGGLDALSGYFATRDSPYRNVAAVIPRGRLDLEPLKTAYLPEMDAPVKRRHTDDARKKYAYLRSVLCGHPELLAVHALVIALLRRREYPPRIRKLFLRMWREEGAFLAAHLPARWLVSAATTFAEIGETPQQRLAGQSFALVFDMIKLHDSERRLSGRPNSIPFPQNPVDDRYPLAFDLDPYSMPDGDLEVTILTRLHKMAEADAVFRPLGRRMLNLLMTDNRTVFARVQQFKTPRSLRGPLATGSDTKMGNRQHD